MSTPLERVERRFTTAFVDGSLVRRDDGVAYWLSARESWVGNALVTLGYERIANGYGRMFPDTEEARTAFDRLGLHLDDILEFKTRRRYGAWEQALRTVVDRLSGRVDWCLVGSASLALRGIEVQPHDIDLVVADAAATADAFADLLVEPLKPMHGWVADWFGRAFDHTLIEWVAGTREDAPDHDAFERGKRILWGAFPILCGPARRQPRTASDPSRPTPKQTLPDDPCRHAH